MIELYNMGISEDTVKSMIEINPLVKDMTKEEVKEKETLLRGVGCSDNEITNIISSNASFLDRTFGELKLLFSKLDELGFTCLNVLFDSNPYILNLEPFEIDNYISKREKKGDKLEDIVDDLDSNPYLFNKI